jgi:Protein of unknown function (DUF3108)
MPLLIRFAGRLAVIAVASLAVLVPAAGNPAVPRPFAPGERLVYSVTWSVFEAGDVVATLQRSSASADQDEVVTMARSHGAVSMLYALNDEFRSRLNPDTMCSYGISKRVAEGRRRKQTQIVFDGARQLAVLDEHNLAKPSEPPKHDEEHIPPCVQDVVSAFYFLRSQPMRVGERIKVPVNDGSKTTEVTAEVQAREQVNTPLGRLYALRVEPTVFGSLYKRKGRMLIWFSDDERHLPLRIKAIMSVGTITGTLRSASGTAVMRAAPSASGALGSSGLPAPPSF